MNTAMHYSEYEITPLQRLIFAYSRSKDRELYHAVFALDNRCAAILRATNEVMLGQMRLAWWRDVIVKPAVERPKGDPVLAALTFLEARGLDLNALTPVVDAWELLLVSEELTMEQVDQYAVQRSAIFEVIANYIDADINGPVVHKAGQIWAKWDLARHSSDDKMRKALISELTSHLDSAESIKLPRKLRPLSILLRLSLSDVKQGDVDKPLMRPATAGTIIWHGVTGI